MSLPLIIMMNTILDDIDIEYKRVDSKNHIYFVAIPN